MRLFFKIFIIIILLFIGYQVVFNREDPYLSEAEKSVNSILGKTASIIKEKYKIKPCGAGAAMPGNAVKQLTLCFDTQEQYTKEQLRELLIKSAQILLHQITINETIQKYLVTTPATIDNVDIIIYNTDKNGIVGVDPIIATAGILNGQLTYKTKDPDDIFKYKNRFNETYQEALKALEESKNKK